MPQHRLGAEDALFVDHRAPARDGGVTFVFFNPLTGDGSSWEARVAPALRAAGHGSLVWNFRGQTDSPVSPGLTVSGGQIVDDEIERLRRAFARESDPDERRRIAAEIQERAYAIATHLPLGQYVEPVAYRSDVTGVLDTPARLFWNIRKE